LGIGGGTMEKGISFVGVRGKGKESDEESREGDESSDGRLWLDETIDVSESDTVLLWGGGKDEGGNSFECIEGRPRPNPDRKLDAGWASLFDAGAPGAGSLSVVSNICKRAEGEIQYR
jgi:hypothetical protein